MALFTLLLFLKSFHWLAEDRVDFMERSPSITALFHVRVILLALILALVDVQFIVHAYGSTVSKGPSVQLVFGFEYAVLVCHTHIAEIRLCMGSILPISNSLHQKCFFRSYETNEHKYHAR